MSMTYSPFDKSDSIAGKVHSFQSLGTIDGPGVRFVVFLQGCNLRCACCHNPDTWNGTEGKRFTAQEVVDKVVRYKEYFGQNGGITLSGGEPLLQAEFSHEVFRLCHSKGINTCLDTSGSVWNDAVLTLLSETDRILLDIKYTTDSMYRKYVGCTMDTPLAFLRYANEKAVPVTLRQVIIPTLNDTAENIRTLRRIANEYPCVDKIELLPFRKICQVKYDDLCIQFPLNHINEPTEDMMATLNSILNED